MHASKFGLLLLAAVAFATPACFTVDKSDDDDGGESGDDSGGSSGKGGSSSGNGGSTSGSGGSSSGNGGSTSGSGGSAAGSGGSGSPACNLSGYQLPEVSCPTGSVSYLDDPTCMDYFSCLVVVGCGAEGSDCADCVTYLEDSLSSTLMCYEGTTSGFAAACASVSQSADSASNYPECVIDG